MKIKEGVIMTGLQIEMRPALIWANEIWKEYGQELVVTSATEGEHSAGSLHYYGFALDFRTRYFNLDDQAKIAKRLRRVLGSKYNVVLHRTHIHVEYDNKEKI